jgi:hypothetical protein
VRIFRKNTKGWSANIEVELKKKKRALDIKYNKLDVEAETRDRTPRRKRSLN